MFETGNGYNNYSMSNNACMAYQNGEKPLTKWKKIDILNAAQKINPSIVCVLKKVSSKILKNELLYKSSWHHTSEYFNKTDFYSIDEEKLEKLSVSDVSSWDLEEKKIEKSKKYKGDFSYLTWEGTRKYPKAVKHELNNVNIEEKGCYYIITNNDGVQLVRKKIGSNGTFAREYLSTEEKEKKPINEVQQAIQKNRIEILQRSRKNASNAAKAFIDELLKDENVEFSQSGGIYKRNRKPSREDYQKGLESFFEKGEKRLYRTSYETVVLEIWNGKAWEQENK